MEEWTRGEGRGRRGRRKGGEEKEEKEGRRGNWFPIFQNAVATLLTRWSPR